ncbi:putative Dol-P-Glc:Glc(2)Man(9)GlcNAc(2)-PP-Dol alpha-1,2-glucosyltransferase isoform X2 [Sipha flava]|nr:putative Dol-P-Glc:Glc(2)Man(9)GlcNAc(2)-PP-Dol alpha-1,2-glucosyltransferase isoform X2 [Sipha flava]
MIGILDNNFLHNYDACSLIALRAVNAIGAPSCLYYAYHRCQQLLLQNERKKSLIGEWSYIILSVSVATFPVIYAPYSMLYYTDAWATASVFLWYSSHLNSKKSSWLKIGLGGFCVLCRQTNIAWLVFATIIDVCHCTEQCFPAVKNSGCTFSYIRACITELYKCCTVKQSNRFNILFNLMKKCWLSTYSNLIVIGSFALFVVFINKGDLVVGDRSAHIPRFHPMQLCYFVIFALTFSLPWILSQYYFNRQITNSFVKQSTIIFFELQKNISIVVLISLATLISGLVYFNTIAHPYLLADNRHYTFYAWRLLFSPGKPVFLRYLPVPLYACGLYYLDTMLIRSSIAYKLAFWIVTPLVLCPQYLLEPRYFVVPYLMYKLHSNRNITNSNTFKAAIFEFITYQMCNFVIMWVFLYHPFTSTMDKTGRLDRFTW